MRSAVLFLAALLLVSPAYSLFLVGQGKAGDTIPVLCEQQERVFVSYPNGSTVQLGLDMGFQAEFVAQSAGPYTVQCGKETKTIQVVPANAPEAQPLSVQDNGGVALAAAGILFAILLFALLIAARGFFAQTEFTKSVEGSRAKLQLKAGKKLEKMEIEDPVSFSYSGKPLRFSIPLLSAGKEWSWEYDIALPEKALPASLEAWEKGKKVSILSRLLIEGKESDAPKLPGFKPSPPKLRKSLPKAK